MSDVTEFLLARITEDEAASRSLTETFRAIEEDWGGAASAILALASPDRVLAECTAKRRLLEVHQPYWYEEWGQHLCSRCAGAAGEGMEWPCDDVRILAAVYAHHPDYDAERWAVRGSGTRQRKDGTWPARPDTDLCVQWWGRGRVEVLPPDIRIGDVIVDGGAL